MSDDARAEVSKLLRERRERRERDATPTAADPGIAEFHGGEPPTDSRIEDRMRARVMRNAAPEAPARDQAPPPEPRRREQEPPPPPAPEPRRRELPREPAQRQPVVAQPEPVNEPGRLISREALMSKYWVWMGVVAALCWVNSIGTTIVFVQWIVGIMFPVLVGKPAILIGVGIGLGLFWGQLMNSTYVVEDPKTGAPVLLRNRRTAYRALLLPDVFMTVWFWFMPILRPVYLLLAFGLTGYALNFFSLVIAAALSIKFGVFSAQFPEKAATDPRLAFGERGRALAGLLLRQKGNAE